MGCRDRIPVASHKGVLEPAAFQLGTGTDAVRWDVTMLEDGSLLVIPVGRRAGRVLVEPRSSNSIRVTTDRIVRSDLPRPT